MNRRIRLGRRVAAHAWRDVPAVAMAASELLLWSARRLSRTPPDRLPAELARWGTVVMDRLRIDLHLAGAEHVDPAEPYVVVALHESFIDAAILTQVGIRPVFTARSELAEWTTLGRVLRRTNQIVLDDARPKQALRSMVREGAARLARGDSVVVFPQGSVLGIEVGFQRGAELLASAAGVRVLPVVLAGGHRVWDYPFDPVVRFGCPVFAEILPPVAAPEWDQLERTMKRIALSNGHAPVRHFEPERDGWWDGYRYEIDPAFGDLAERHRRHVARTSHSSG